MFTKGDRFMLNQIFNKQKIIMEQLNNINRQLQITNDIIVKYCGGEHEFETEKLKQKMLNAKFTKNQLELIYDLIDYKTKQYVKKEGD